MAAKIIFTLIVAINTLVVATMSFKGAKSRQEVT